MLSPSSSRRRRNRREDLPANRRVEAGHRFVGDEHARVQHEGAGDHDALALPTRQFVRVTVHELLGGPQPRASERRGDEGSLITGDLVHAKTLGDRLVDGVPGVQGSQRVLEDVLDVASVGRRPLCFVGSGSSP